MMSDRDERNDGRPETVDDIVAEMRNKPIPPHTRDREMLVRLAERIKAAHIREVQAEQEVAEDALFKLDEAERRAGNAAAMREALEDMVKHDDRMTGCDVFLFGHTSCNGKTTAGECHFKSHCDRVFRAMAALSAPPRNCDVFPTWEKAAEAWGKSPEWSECPDAGWAWLFDPAKKEGGE